MPRTATPGTADEGERVGDGALPTRPYLTAKEVAARFGVSTDWVYDHKTELGAIPMGNGKKPRLRFSATTCDRYMLGQAERHAASETPRSRKHGGRPRNSDHTPSGLLTRRPLVIPVS